MAQTAHGRGGSEPPRPAPAADELSELLITTTLPVPGQPGARLLISPHRPSKATVQGRAHLPARVLTEAGTLAVCCPARPAHAPRAPERGSRR